MELAPLAFSAGDDLLLAGLLAAGLLLLAASQFVRIPYPIVLVLGGLALGFIPGMPEIELRPEIVLVACCRRCSTAPRSSRRCASCGRTSRPISALAIGLVLTTTLAVAAVAHAS